MISRQCSILVGGLARYRAEKLKTDMQNPKTSVHLMPANLSLSRYGAPKLRLSNPIPVPPVDVLVTHAV